MESEVARPFFDPPVHPSYGPEASKQVAGVAQERAAIAAGSLREAHHILDQFASGGADPMGSPLTPVSPLMASLEDSVELAGKLCERLRQLWEKVGVVS